MSSTENRFSIADTTSIISPALVVFEEGLRDNLDERIRVAGDVSRLRPHCKAHKVLCKNVQHNYIKNTMKTLESEDEVGLRNPWFCYIRVEKT